MAESAGEGAVVEAEVADIRGVAGEKPTREILGTVFCIGNFMFSHFSKNGGNGL